MKYLTERGRVGQTSPLAYGCLIQVKCRWALLILTFFSMTPILQLKVKSRDKCLLKYLPLTWSSPGGISARQFYFAPNAPYDLLTRKPVKTLADLNGMRIGHTPVEFVPAFSKAGAASVISSAQEFYSRLERGLIDGICLNVNIMKIYKLHEVAKYYTTINLNTTALFTLYINADTWKKLSTEDQGVFRDTAKEAEQFYLDGLNKEVADARKLYQDAGIQFYEMPASDTKQWAISLPDVPAEWAKKMEAKGAAGWQIVNRYLELSKKEGWEFPRKWGVR